MIPGTLGCRQAFRVLHENLVGWFLRCSELLRSSPSPTFVEIQRPSNAVPSAREHLKQKHDKDLSIIDNVIDMKGWKCLAKITYNVSAWGGSMDYQRQLSAWEGKVLDTTPNLGLKFWYGYINLQAFCGWHFGSKYLTILITT